jgi:hypothetical protein
MWAEYRCKMHWCWFFCLVAKRKRERGMGRERAVRRYLIFMNPVYLATPWLRPWTWQKMSISAKQEGTLQERTNASTLMGMDEGSQGEEPFSRKRAEQQGRYRPIWRAITQ